MRSSFEASPFLSMAFRLANIFGIASAMSCADLVEDQADDLGINRKKNIEKNDH